MSSGRASLLRILAVALLLGGAAALAARAGASAADVLCVAPAALLALLAALRRYPGARTLVALAERRRRVARPRAAQAGGRPRPGTAALPRGGALLAFGLAVRPPPAALAR